MDSQLAGIAAKLGWTCTRYADDFSISADEAWLGGTVAYVAMVNPKQTEPPRSAYEVVRGRV